MNTNSLTLRTIALSRAGCALAVRPKSPFIFLQNWRFFFVSRPYTLIGEKKSLRTLAFLATALLAFDLPSPAQQQPPTPVAAPRNSPAPADPAETERWNLFYQATSIGQYHGTFNSPYSSPFSLQDYPERDVSLTTTFFFGLRWVITRNSTSIRRLLEVVASVA